MGKDDTEPEAPVPVVRETVDKRNDRQAIPHLEEVIDDSMEESDMDYEVLVEIDLDLGRDENFAKEDEDGMEGDLLKYRPLFRGSCLAKIAN